MIPHNFTKKTILPLVVIFFIAIFLLFSGENSSAQYGGGDPTPTPTSGPISTTLAANDFYFAPVSIDLGQATNIQGWLRTSAGAGVGGKTIQLVCYNDGTSGALTAGWYYPEGPPQGTTEPSAPNTGYTSFSWTPNSNWGGDTSCYLEFGGDASYSASTSVPKTLTINLVATPTPTPTPPSSPTNTPTPIPGTLSYPTDRWQRLWYNWGAGKEDFSNAQYLGETSETNEQFTTDWVGGQPYPGKSDNVKFRSSKAIYISTAKNYRISLGSDDGSRLYIDGGVKIDDYTSHSWREKSADVPLTVGWHNFQIDYYENTQDAKITFNYYDAPSANCWKMTSDVGGDVCNYNYYRPDSGDPLTACRTAGADSPENRNGNICCQNAGGTCTNKGVVWVTAYCCLNAIPTPTPTPTLTPTPIPCQVTTDPPSQTLILGGASGTVTASVTSGLNGTGITQMRFGSYDTTIATATTPDTTSPYSTTTSPVAVGTTAVWATADLADGRTCESIGVTDTDITVVTPTPTPTPTPTNTPTPTITPTPTPIKYIVYGEVYHDKNNNYAWDSGETLLEGNAISVEDVTGEGTPSGIYSTDTNGWYETTGRLWEKDHTIKVDLGALPSGCTSSYPDPNQFAITQDRYVDWPYTCTVTVQGRNVGDTAGTPLPPPDIGAQTVTINGPAGSPINPDPTRTELGAWDFTGIPSGSYTVSASVPAGYDVTYSKDIQGTSHPTPFTAGSSTNVALDGSPANNYADIWFRYQGVLIQGHNVDVDGMELTSSIGQSITISGPKTYTRDDIGYWYFNEVPKGTYTVNANVPAGYTVKYQNPYVAGGSYSSCGNPCSISGISLPAAGNSADIRFQYILTPTPTPTPTSTPTPTPTSTPTPTPTPTPTNTPTPTPTPTPIPVYSISGKIFNDVNGNEKSNGEANYVSAITITRSPALGTYNSPVGTGNYSFTNLFAGQYTITFSGLPAGWGFTYPPYSLLCSNESCFYQITVGPNCASSPPPATSEASCLGGNVIGLNSGVTNTASAWIQTTGADLRWDSGFINPLPAVNTYSSIQGLGGMPGIIFSGEATANFGPSRKASENRFNWQVGGSTSESREVFTDTHGLIPTSYRFLLETAEGSGITPASPVSFANNGIYKTGSLTINSPVTFGAGNFIILIDGDLTINAKITVPVGSTAIFSVKGNIIVDRTIGEPGTTSCDTTTHAGCSIEGLYSADGNFIADGNNSCPIIDKRLNVAGSVIANAGRGGGTFINNRTLCGGNTSNPTVSFVERPDFILNYPSIVTQTTRAWQDVAP